MEHWNTFRQDYSLHGCRDWHFLESYMKVNAATPRYANMKINPSGYILNPNTGLLTGQGGIKICSKGENRTRKETRSSDNNLHTLYQTAHLHVQHFLKSSPVFLGSFTSQVADGLGLLKWAQFDRQGVIPPPVTN